jgi:DNA-directed RNA polymerase subunit RPC12/RpoP
MASPYATCPHCGTDRPALLIALDGTRRGYRCPDCRGEFAVDGIQTQLDLGTIPDDGFRLT